MSRFFNFYLVLLLLVFSGQVHATIRVPSFVGDSMVLQRNMKIPVWGWATPGASITVQFKGKTYRSTTAADGKWVVRMDAMPAGGPFDMRIEGDGNPLIIKNILIGDVWICSGQSNMQFDFNNVKTKYADEIAASANNAIRIITINRTYAHTPQQDCKSNGWRAASPQSILSFSAAGYFFGNELNAKYNIPIGLIATNYGGTPSEAWTSEEGLRSFPRFNDGISYMKDTAAVNKRIQESKDRTLAWNTKTKTDDSGYISSKPVWAQNDYDDNSWSSDEMPRMWDKFGYRNTFGVIWFRKKIEIPQSVAGHDAVLYLGSIDDEDETFVNGTRVGGYANRTKPREHQVPGNLLKPGINIIAIRVVNWDNAGGMVGDQPMRLTAAGQSISLQGAWKYKTGLKLTQRPANYVPVSVPTSLYNSMIAPLLPYAIKGVIWYQGETNADRAYEYKEIFPAMIKDWRNQWGQGDFPFIYQQLVNIRAPKPEPSESDWAELREAQLQTLAVPNTAMAVGIDIGEAYDIHPLNKKDVGHRLALAAEKIAYKDAVPGFSAPVYQSMKRSGDKIILRFNTYGSDLVAQGGGELKRFAIAGSDRKFVWANAVIKNNKVEVWSDAVKDPVAVRYAWADNPEGCNLYNKEGIPASPFRTDDWPGLTISKQYVFK
jgi:sialate O-acetylesterase